MSKAPASAAATGSPATSDDIDNSTRDARLARAMELFEYRMHDLVCATKLLEAMKRSTLDELDGPIVTMVRERCSFLEDFHVHVFDKDESEALSYAIHHVGNLAREMNRDFLAALMDERAS